MLRDWTSRKIPISTKYSSTERKAIASEIISYIVARTKKGKGKDNQPWEGKASGYSKSYKKSLEFKIAGKSSTVNLKLSGDMLNSIKLLSNDSGSLKIGIPKSDSDNKKAEGNIRGSYGKKTGSKSKARDFLAISQKEVSKILEQFPLKDTEKLLQIVTDIKLIDEAIDLEN